MDSTDIYKLLQIRHEKDLIVPECKTGATWNNGHLLILDAWIMKRSWAHPMAIGYEIKVNRQDFLRDEKWRGYLPFCNMFYFVCPHGLILPTELPAEIGLLYASKTGTKLFEKKKSVHRQINIPDSLYRYLLMNRIKIVDDQNSLTKKEFWDRWLKEKEENRHFGHLVSGKIKKELEQRVTKVREENEKLSKEIKNLQQVRDIIKNMGFKEEEIIQWGFKRNVRQKLEELKSGISQEIDLFLNDGIKNLKQIKKVLGKIRGTDGQ